MNKYKAVLFDYDGTLVDTNQLIIDSWNHMSTKLFGVPTTGEDIGWSFGIVLRDAMEIEAERRGWTGYTPDELCAHYREYQTQDRIESVKPFDGIMDAVLALKAKGMKLGIVTSRGLESCFAGLKKNGLKDCFDYLVTMETTDIHKPEPEPALICCEGLGVAPQDAVMVGDSVFDLQCGNAAGCDSCFVTWSVGTTPEKAVREGHPTYIVSDPKEFVSLFCAENDK